MNCPKCGADACGCANCGWRSDGGQSKRDKMVADYCALASAVYREISPDYMSANDGFCVRCGATNDNFQNERLAFNFIVEAVKKALADRGCPVDHVDEYLEANNLWFNEPHKG